MAQVDNGTADFVNNENGHPGDASGEQSMTSQAMVNAVEPRSTFLRPWAKRDHAIENLQGGITAIRRLDDRHPRSLGAPVRAAG